jgi:hypothetical protein
MMLQGTCKFGDACRYFHPKPHAVNPALAPSGEFAFMCYSGTTGSR